MRPSGGRRLLRTDGHDLRTTDDLLMPKWDAAEERAAVSSAQGVSARSGRGAAHRRLLSCRCASFKCCPESITQLEGSRPKTAFDGRLIAFSLTHPCASLTSRAVITCA